MYGQAIRGSLLQVRAGVAYVLLGGTPFWGRTEVKDVVAYLRLAANLDDVAGAHDVAHLLYFSHIGTWVSQGARAT